MATLPLAGIVIGWALIESPSVILPLTLQVLALAAITMVFVSRERDPEIRRGLTRLVLAAFFLRAAAFTFTHFVLSPFFFAPDAIGYAREGLRISNYWMGLGPAPVDTGRFQLYHYLNGLLYYIYGDGAVAASVLNAFAGIWSCLVVFYLGRRLFGLKTAWIAGGLVAAFPSLVLWSVLNIRDSLATFVILLAILAATRLVMDRHQRSASIALFAFSAVVLWTLRDYMAFLVVSGAAVGATASARPGRMGRSLIAGLLLVLGAVVLGEQAGLIEQVQEGQALNTAELIREGMRGDAGSAIRQVQGQSTTTVSGAIRYLPVGMAYITFAPFPWAVTSTLQLFTMPEVLLWYALFPFMIIGVRTRIRKHGSPHAILLAVILVVVATYGLVEGNVGTAYRHRAQIMPLALLYVAAGITVATAWARRLVEARRPKRNPFAPRLTEARVGRRRR